MTIAMLIDVDAFCDFWNKNYRHQYANDNFLFALENFPTVDAVEVVRCQDCKHHDDTSISEYKHCFVNNRTVQSDDFCSFGERKGGDDNGC